MDIRLINQPWISILYYVPTNDAIELISEISKLNILLENLYDDLLGLAQKNCFVDMLSIELRSSNQLEGVKSSREEIVQTTRKGIRRRKR